MRNYPLEIVTPDGVSFSGEAQSLTVRTESGDVQILAGHVDYLAALATGPCRVVDAGGKVRFASASGGFLSVAGGAVRLVTTTFEYADRIDLDRAKAAKERAERALRVAKDEREERIAKAKLSRANARIYVASMK